MEENQLLMKQVKSLIEQSQVHSDVYMLSQQSLEEKLNVVGRYKRVLEEKVHELNNNDRDKKTFMNKAAKALKLKVSTIFKCNYYCNLFSDYSPSCQAIC